VLLWVWLQSDSIEFNYCALKFAGFGAMYGSIGSGVAMMFHFFFFAVLLFGAEINAVIGHHARSATHVPDPPRLTSRIKHGETQFCE
jgi:uncharacterized BrkB/YihY/UPF0761 family membrane protein